MNEPHDDNRTFHIPSAPGDSLDAGLAAAFGRPPDGPRSSLGAAPPPVVLKPAEGESAHVVKPKSDALPPPAQAGDRYQLQGEIARGGMGAILRGRDVDLGRDLAVKVLLEKYADRPEVVRRFIEEAQICGQLQHPNVVPIYDIGRFGGRPFFTMKLVKGQTLAALLAEREQPTEDRPRLLGVALQVCQAMAYAHAKGVIHRDLKPANVMVGAFGEVQVMDWGLAKVLAEGGLADEERASRQYQDEGTQVRTARSGTAGSHGSDTEAGSLLGTPAYMPPEQANGDVALLDRRADVFGLGAILCEILTGKPPYVGRSAEEVRRKAANGDLADAVARLDGCGADPELIALTKACLSAEAADRPRDAQAVADGLAAYLDGVQERLQAAQRERAVAVVRAREEGKRRKVQLALAAAVLGLLLGGGGFAWWRNDVARAGRERDARNAEAVAALLGQCEGALRAGDAAKAQVALEAARKRSAEGGAEGQAARLDQLAADLALLRDLDEIDQFRWTSVGGDLPDRAAVAARTREALRRFGADTDAVPADGAAARVAASAVRGRIVSALDRVVQLQRSKAAGARAVLRLVDADPYRDAVRDAILAGDLAKSAELAGQPAALEQPAAFAAFLSARPEIKWERRRQLLAAAVVRWPGDLDLLMTLGSASPAHGKDGADEELRWRQAAVAAAPANPVARINLGASLREKGQLDEAIAVYQKAIELDPKLGMARYALGVALQAKGQVDEAIACFRKAIALDPKIAWAHKGLGDELRLKGRVDEAIACFRKAIALAPKDADARTHLGNALQAKGQLDEAIASHRTAIALDPKNAAAHSNLGNALRSNGQLDEAIACWRKAIALDPKYAGAHNNLRLALRAKGQVDEAIACYRKAIELDPKFALAHTNLGDALLGKGRVDEAIACYRKAIALDPKLAKAHGALAQALLEQGRCAEAKDATARALALLPEQNSLRATVTQQLQTCERFLKLEERLPRFLRGEDKAASARESLDLAQLCRHKRSYAAAARFSAEALAADPRLADNLQAGHRYSAACHAALAAAGQGEDAAQPDDKERARLRQQALAWLEADLALRKKQLKSRQSGQAARARAALAHWQNDPDLAGIRDKGALGKLPAQQQKAFAQLWADVAATLRKADKGTK
jgi:eukaryotic-like serine/threonine-protein kinase